MRFTGINTSKPTGVHPFLHLPYGKVVRMTLAAVPKCSWVLAVWIGQILSNRLRVVVTATVLWVSYYKGLDGADGDWGRWFVKSRYWVLLLIWH